MKESIVKRTLEEAEHILSTGATVRETAATFDVSKSTVHKDVSERLKYINADLWREVKKILEFNLAERHIRGGNATKNKYLHSRD